MSMGTGVLLEDGELVPGAEDDVVVDFVEPVPASRSNLFPFNLRKIAGFPEQSGGTLAYDNGYIEGQIFRKRGTAPSTYALVGRDDYCLGFRAGYFASDRKSLQSPQS